MKKFLAILLTIIATATTIVLVGLFTIPYVGSEAIKIIANQALDDSVVDSNDLYQEAEDLGISQDKIDKALSNDEMKEYVNTILKEVIDKKTSNKSEVDEELIKEKTKEFLEKVNKNYDIKLSDEKLKEISDNASEEVIESSNEMIEDKDNDISGFLDVISFCNNSKVRGLTITLKKLSFFLYYTFISLFTATLIAILTFLMNFILSSEKDLEILVSLISKGYKLALVFLILGIVFIIIHNIIKHCTNKEVVPF